MIPVEQARAVVLKETRILGIETVSFRDSFLRVLAQDVRATTDLPSFNRSTVDGFAVRSADLKQGVKLKIVDVVAAGKPSKRSVHKGQAVKIMTGGVVPKGADCVVMKEKTTLEGNNVVILEEMARGENISFQGEDVKRGSLIIEKGSLINAGVVGLLAALGLTDVKVYRKPKAAILVTGNELLKPNEKLVPGKIRSANEYALFSQLKEAGAKPVILGIARDNLAQTKQKILQGLRHDIFLVSGGVSVGDFDLVPKVLRDLGVKIFFEKVSIQPGKPLIFGKLRNTYVFGLPGNPVSTMVSFYEFVRPCLLKMCGRKDILLNRAVAILDENIHLRPSRTKILRGRTFIRGGQLFVRLTSHQGSGNIISMAKANCIFEVAEGTTKINKGSKITIQYLP